MRTTFAKQAPRRNSVVRKSPRIVRPVRVAQQPQVSTRKVAPVRASKRFIAPSILFLALIGQLYVRVSIIERGYQVEEVRRQISSADEQLRQLQLDYAYVTRPQRVSQIAQNSFGLVRTSPDKVRVLELSAQGDSDV